jgi:hypothetical protein
MIKCLGGIPHYDPKMRNPRMQFTINRLLDEYEKKDKSEINNILKKKPQPPLTS